MNLRTTELGMPIQVYTVLIKVAHYGLIVVPCSDEERAEMVVEQAYKKYLDVLDVDIQYGWLDDWNEDLDYLH